MQEKLRFILKNSTVLLAEDDQNLRESFVKVLLFYVGNVISAADGEEALQLYEEKQPDIIISDIKMPKLNGVTFIKKVREKDRTIPIIVTSAYTDRDFLLESIKLSLVEYIVKPMRETDLIRLLETCAKLILEKSQTYLKVDENYIYDFTNKVLKHKENCIILTNKEVDFFEMLLAHRGNLVTRQMIEDKLYIYEEAPPSALKNLVFKLRKKIGNKIIKTVGNLGYSIEK
ncbi:MAG: response regulator transcription factor [Sulfurospirillum sp.]|nr:response regulator transcription factor [Sulfurospirillum sp.]